MAEDKILQKLEQQDKKFDRIIDKLVEHDEKLDNMVTRDEFHTFEIDATRRLEEIVTIVKKLDEERVFLTEWMKRIEDRVNRYEKQLEEQNEEILKIKALLKLT